MWFKREKRSEQDDALSESLRSLQTLLSENGRREPSLDAGESDPDATAGGRSPGPESRPAPTQNTHAAERRPEDDNRSIREPALPGDSGNRWRDLSLNFDAEPVLPRSRRAALDAVPGNDQAEPPPDTGLEARTDSETDRETDLETDAEPLAVSHESASLTDSQQNAAAADDPEVFAGAEHSVAPDDDVVSPEVVWDPGPLAPEPAGTDATEQSTQGGTDSAVSPAASEFAPPAADTDSDGRNTRATASDQESATGTAPADIPPAGTGETDAPEDGDKDGSGPDRVRPGPDEDAPPTTPPHDAGGDPGMAQRDEPDPDEVPVTTFDPGAEYGSRDDVLVLDLDDQQAGEPSDSPAADATIFGEDAGTTTFDDEAEPGLAHDSAERPTTDAMEPGPEPGDTTEPDPASPTTSDEDPMPLARNGDDAAVAEIPVVTEAVYVPESRAPSRFESAPGSGPAATRVEACIDRLRTRLQISSAEPLTRVQEQALRNTLNDVLIDSPADSSVDSLGGSPNEPDTH